MGRHSHVLQMSRWLLDCSALQLTESGETPTYQKTIGEVTGCKCVAVDRLAARVHATGRFNLR